MTTNPKKTVSIPLFHNQQTSSATTNPTSLPLSQLQLRSRDVRSGVDAVVRRTRRNLRRLLVIVVGALVLDADVVDAGGDDVGEGGGVAVVGVDTGELTAVGGGDVVEDDVALVHGVAVAAGAVELAEGLDGEAGDGEGAGAVVLEDFVFLYKGSALLQLDI